MDEKLEQILNKNLLHCLENFDYEKVMNVMSFLNWQWWWAGVPNKDNIIAMIKENFTSCKKYIKDDSRASVSSGGIEVTIFKTGRVKVQFVLTEVYGEFENGMD